MLSLALVFSSCTEKEIKDVLELVSNETVTVSAKGGDCIIEVNSNSALSAVSSAEWVKTEVIDNSNVKATVDPYEGSEVRTATVTVSNAGSAAPVTVRINQAAVNFDFTPSDYEFEAGEGQYSFPYTADAALKAEVEEGVEWLEVEVTETELVLKAKANEAIRKRAADVNWTIGTVKGSFTVSQKGAEATLESENFKDGNFDAVNAPLMGTNVVYSYTTNSELEVSSEQDWIETYTEDGKFYINVLVNNGEAREGVVVWAVKESASLRGEIAVSQKGNILKINAYPYDYNAQYTSANTFVVRIETTNCTDVRRKLYVSTALAGATYEELLEEGRLCNSVVDEQFTMEKFNGAGGMGMISPMGSVPDNHTIAVLVYATDGESEQVAVNYVHFSNGDQNKTFAKADLQKKTSKDAYYGKYHALFSTTDQTTTDFQTISVMGNVLISDGEAAVDQNGQTRELVKVSGLWNTQFNSRVSLNDDMYYYYIDGLLYSFDQELDILYLDGEPYSTGKLTTLTRMADGKLYEAQLVLVGGVINDEGYVAFVANDGDLVYDATYLVDDEGYWCIAKDFMLIPDGAPVDAGTVAAAQKKLAKVKKTMRSMKGNGAYVEKVDNRFQRALKIVEAEEQSALAPVAALNN